ncbi:MAG: tetratricopeptide repeat-containing sulfotransferase family protein [Gammaproteobacteria bacterium]
MRAGAGENLQRLLAWQRAGRWRPAAAGYCRILRADPRCVEAWHFYALLIYERGHARTARRFMERAARLAPDEISVLTNLARMLRETGEPEAAERQLAHVLALAPMHPPAWIQLALIRIAQDRADELREPFAHLLARYPDAAQLWTLSGSCHEQAADWECALAAYARAANLAPRDPEPWLHRAEIEERLGLADQAESSYRHALALDPRCASAICALGSLAGQRGNFAEGERLARRALEADRSCYEAWLNRVLGCRDRAASDLMSGLVAATHEAGADPAASPLYFALGMCREAAGDYDGAFTAYAEANVRRAHELPYDRDGQIDYFRGIIAYLGKDFAARAGRIGDSTTRPIFVLGMPRSGTTLTESLLAAHSTVHAGGEMHWVHDLLRRRAGRVNAKERVGEWLASRSDAQLADIAGEWRRGLETLAPDGARITDKMPTNFMLVALLHLCFPRAAIVHVRRDPLDNCFSCFATAFGQGHSFSNELATLGEFYLFYEALMVHWRRTLGAKRLIEVRYERLVAEPEQALRDLMVALDLPWEEDCLERYRERLLIRTASLWQARQPVYRSAQGRWRHFERHLEPLRKALQQPSAAAPLNPSGEKHSPVRDDEAVS